ncbi:unnamed protein product [Callosobruchus maculatus]|nr:unnamed protein product [Callosobruchus maculatus]
MGNITQCLFMLKYSDASQKLISHILPSMMRSKVMTEDASADGAECNFQSPRRNETLDKSIYGTDISVQSRDIWEITKSMNRSSDSFEAISESNISQHSKRSGLESPDQGLAQPQAPPVPAKSALKMPSQAQALPVIIEESAHYQVVPDSQEADRTAALQVGSEGFYTAQEDNPMSLDLDSLDVNVCDDVALQAQLAAFRVSEKENQIKMQSPEPRVGVPLKSYDYLMVVSDTANSDADIRVSCSAENEKKKPSKRRRRPLQERNAAASVKDTAAPVGLACAPGSPTVSEVVIPPTPKEKTAKTSGKLASAKLLRPCTPTLPDVVLDTKPESVEKDPQATTDRQNVKVSQTIETCIGQEQHDGIQNRSLTTDADEDADDNESVKSVVNLISSDTDATVIPPKKKKTLRKLNTTLSEETRCSERTAKDSRTELAMSSGDENFVTQYGKEPKRVLGKVRSSGRIKELRRRAKDKIQSITERGRKIARFNSSASTDILEEESRMTKQIVKDIDAEKEQHMEVLSLDVNDNVPVASLDLPKMNSSSDDSVFGAEQTPVLSQASKKAIVMKSSIEKQEFAPPKQDKVTKSLGVDVKQNEDLNRKTPQRINSDHESIFGASSSAPSEMIEGKPRPLRLSSKWTDRTANKLMKKPDLLFDDEVAKMLQRMHSSEDGAGIPVDSSFGLENMEEKSKGNSEAKSGINKEFVVPGKENNVKSYQRKSKARQQIVEKGGVNKIVASRKDDTEFKENTKDYRDDTKSSNDENIQISKTSNMSASKSGIDKKDEVPKNNEITEGSEAFPKDDISSSSDESFAAARSRTPPKKVTKSKTKKRKDEKVADPKKTTKTLTIDKFRQESDETQEYDSDSSSDESITAAKFSGSPRKTETEPRVTRQSNVTKVSPKGKGAAALKKNRASKTVKTNEQATENGIDSLSDDSIIAGNSSQSRKKKKSSRANRQTRRQDKSIKARAGRDSSKKSDEDLKNEVNSSNDDTTDFKKKATQKSKKTRLPTKKTIKSKISYSSDESQFYLRKKKRLHKLDSSPSNDGTPENMANKKSSQKNTFIEDTSKNTKSFVDELLEKMEAQDGLGMPSRPVSRSRGENEFDKLKTGNTEKTYLKSAKVPKDSEHKWQAETEPEREKRQPSQPVYHTNKHSSDAESHVGRKIIIQSDVILVQAKHVHQQKQILEHAAPPEAEQSFSNGAEEDIILATPLENRPNTNQEIVASGGNVSVSEKPTSKLSDRRQTRSYTKQAEIKIILSRADGDKEIASRKAKDQELPKPINIMPTTEVTEGNKDKDAIRKDAMSKLRKMQDEIRVMSDDDTGRNRSSGGDQIKSTQGPKTARRRSFNLEERIIEQTADIIVHKDANESEMPLTRHADQLNVSDEVSKKEKTVETGGLTKSIITEDDVDGRSEYTNNSHPRRRTRKLFDQSVPWYEMSAPDMNERSITTRTNEKSIETHENRNNVSILQKTGESGVKNRNWKGLNLVIPEETSTFRSNARISPVALEDVDHKNKRSPAEKVVILSGNKTRDEALARLVKYENKDRKRSQSETLYHSKPGHYKGTTTRGLGAFHDIIESFLSGSKHKFKPNKTWTSPKRQRAPRKSTSHRLSRKKPLDTVMRDEKGEMSPVSKIKRRKIDGNVSPEFEGDVRIPPIRTMPEEENDVLVNDGKKEHGGYVFELVEAPEWVGNAVQGSKRTELRSTDFHGKYLLMFFYPSDFGYIVAAPKELEEFSAVIDTFKSLNVEVVGCCTNDINVHMELLAQKPNILIPLIADSTLEISMAFSVYVPRWGHNLRAAILIDPKGTILWRFLLHDATRCLPVDQLLSFVKWQVG